MTTLKEHQEILKSLDGKEFDSKAATCLASALYDVLDMLNNPPATSFNDAALAYEIERATQHQAPNVSQLENTIRQLREANAKLRGERDHWRKQDALKLEHIRQLTAVTPEQAGCRKDDTQDDGWIPWTGWDDGWIPWTGGKCPVRASDKVEVRFRDGGYSYDQVAGFWDWKHGCYDGDIVAYRVQK